MKREFVKTVKRVENTDGSSYRTFRLKQRLGKRFPQLVFHRPKVRNKSEIVYAECLSQASVAESLRMMTSKRLRVHKSLNLMMTLERKHPRTQVQH